MGNLTQENSEQPVWPDSGKCNSQRPGCVYGEDGNLSHNKQYVFLDGREYY